jgi:hypothetical protein
MRILLASLLLCSIATCQIVMAQNLVVQPSSIDGVEFIGPGDAGFPGMVTVLAGATPPPAESDWLPYSGVLVNHTSGKILAVAVRWVKTLPKGQTDTFVFSHKFFPNPAREIAPGGAVVVLPGWLFMKPLPTGGRDATDQMDHASQIQSYRSATRVEMSLDAVVLSSGQCVGPDQSGECGKWIAKEQARQLYADESSRFANGASAKEIVDWLTSMSNPSGSQDLLQREIAANAKILLKGYSKGGIEWLNRFVASNAPQPGDVKVFR